MRSTRFFEIVERAAPGKQILGCASESLLRELMICRPLAVNTIVDLSTRLAGEGSDWSFIASSLAPPVTPEIADALLECAGGDVQVFSTRVDGRRDVRKVVNVLTTYEAAEPADPPDLSSQFSGLPVGYSVDSSRVGSARIFRVRGGGLVIDDALHDRLRRLEVAGSRFVRVPTA